MWEGEGLLGIETEGKLLPTRASGAPQRLVCCVVWRCGRRRWVEVTGVWRQGWGAVGVELSSPRRKLLLREEAGGTARSLLLL